MPDEIIDLEILSGGPLFNAELDDIDLVAIYGDVDTEMSDTSENPVQNQVIKEYIDDLQTALNSKVDDSQVLTDVPLNALFTDTIYTHPSTHSADMITDGTNNHLLTTALKGNYDSAYSHSQATHAPSNAEANVNADWNAVSGDAQILNKPSIPNAQVQSDWNATEGMGAVLNKPTSMTPTSHSHPASEVTDFDTEVGNNIDVSANTSARHSHLYQSVLDAITSTMTSAWNGLVTMFTSITGVVTTVTDDDTKIPTSGAIVDYVSSLGGGNMTTQVYDTDSDGKVNSAVTADNVGGFTVGVSVPANAVFTDTVYEHPSTHSADIIVDGTTNKAYTATEQSKLSGIATGAEVNVQSDWSATEGDALILNKPTIPNAYTLSQATETTLGGIAAATKTTESAEVKIDAATGKLYAPAAGEAENGVAPGGTTGQVYAKIDGTDYNAEWIDAPSGGGISVDFDETTTTEGQNKTRTTSGSFLYLEVEVAILRPIKLTTVLWDIYGIDTYTLSVDGDNTVAAPVTTTVNNTPEVEFELFEPKFLMPGPCFLRITGTTSQKMNDTGSSAYSGTFVSFTKNSSYGGSISDFYPSIKLVAYKGAWVDAQGGGSSYTLPQATETALGGIIAAEKTSGETQEVKIDTTTGKLYSTPPGEAENGVPAGGTAKQVLSKIDETDYNGEWTNLKKAISFLINEDLTVESAGNLFIVPFGMTITEIRLAVGVAPTGADLILDINKNGTTLYTTQGNRPTITAGNTSATATDPDVTSLAKGDVLTLDIDQVGSTVAGSNLAVTIICEVV